MEQVAIVVLAAGEASRMGQPKQLLKIGPQSLVQRVIQMALAASCCPVVVITGAYADQVQQAVDGLPVTCIHNAAWKKGMGTSIRTGVLAVLDAHPDTEALIILLCDQPLVSPQLLRQLIATHTVTQQALVVSVYGGIRGVPALFHRSLFPLLLSLTGVMGARKLIEQRQEALATVPFPEGIYDVDTPADYEQIKQLLGFTP